MKKRSYNHKLTWSNTRITLLEYCEKKYFLNYYSQALKDIDQDLRKITTTLKKLKSIEMWMGEKTHLLIAEYLNLLKNKEDTPENIQNIIQKNSQQMREEFQASKEKDYTSYDYQNKGGLSEHFYQENIDEKLEPIIQRVSDNLIELQNSSRKEKIDYIIKNTGMLYIENPKNPDFEAMKLNTQSIPELKDINIMASPDFGAYIGDKYFILDRKSGKEPFDMSEKSDQINVYALKLLLNTKKQTLIENMNIEGYEVYLPSMKKRGGGISQEDIDEIIQKISQDSKFQKTFLIDQDPVLNKPLASTTFSRTAQKKKCESCTLRKACALLERFE